MRTRQIGIEIEKFAVKHIIKHGYQLLDTNYYCPFGEIDVICKYENCIIFIEVRYRKNTAYGKAIETVSIVKQQKIIKTAKHFLVQHPQYNNMETRFDVIGIEGNNLQLEWI